MWHSFGTKQRIIFFASSNKRRQASIPLEVLLFVFYIEQSTLQKHPNMSCFCRILRLQAKGDLKECFNSLQGAVKLPSLVIDYQKTLADVRQGPKKNCTAWSGYLNFSSVFFLSSILSLISAISCKTKQFISMNRDLKTEIGILQL